MTRFEITYEDHNGEIQTMIEIAAEAWMLNGSVEEWGLGVTISIVELS